MLRMDVPSMSDKKLVTLRVPVSEEVRHIYIFKHDRSFGKRCWNRFMIFWNVRRRLRDSEKSTYVDGVSRLSRIAICERS
jgi:hypothetical protein